MGRFDNLSPLKKWIISNRYFIKTSEPRERKAEATHYLLDGGIWKVPLEHYPNFLKLLADDLNNGEKHYISENKTNIFKFICDLDFYEETVISVKQVEHIVTVIQEIVTEYFGNQRVIICGADSKTVTINEINFIKSGFHLVFPKLWITVDTSKRLRIIIIERLIEKFKERENHNKWEDVVDLSVYEDNGLRMVGCRKIGPCKTCKNKREIRDTCQMCEGVGKIDENRIYKPVSVLPNDSVYFETIKNDYYVMLLETSIYNYSLRESTPLIKQINVELPVTKKSKKGGRGKTNNLNELDLKIETFIQRNFREHYSRSQVKRVSKSETSNSQVVYFVEIDDNYCMNVNRNHTSSSIYFEIKASGICQRCYCKKESCEGRLHGNCREYHSKEIALNKTLKNLLFGEVKCNKLSIVKFNITKGNDREKCLNNCKNILWQLKNELT
jgi:hypothetical protein